MAEVTAWIIAITGVVVIWALLFILIGWALKRIMQHFKVYGLFFQFMVDQYRKKKS